MPLDVFDQTIGVLKSAVGKARLGQREELAALRRLDDQSRLMERTARGARLAALIERERAASHGYGGMTVFGPAEPPPITGARVRTAR